MRCVALWVTVALLAGCDDGALLGLSPAPPTLKLGHAPVLITVSDLPNYRSEFTYENGLLTAVASGAYKFEYDERGLVIRQTVEQNPVVCQYSYDDQDRLTRMVTEVRDEGELYVRLEDYAYDDAGRLVTVRSWANGQFDDDGSYVGGNVLREETRDYDSAGRLAGVWVGAEPEILLHRDATGRVTAAERRGSTLNGTPILLTTSYVRDGNGRVTQVWQGTRLRFAYDYDDNEEVRAIRAYLPGGTLENIHVIVRDPTLDAAFWLGPWNVTNDVTPEGDLYVFAGIEP